MPTLTMTAQELKHRARELRFTHEEIANKIGVSRQTVTDTFAGRSNHPATRYAIARVLEVDPDRVEWNNRQKRGRP